MSELQISKLSDASLLNLFKTSLDNESLMSKLRKELNKRSEFYI